MSTNEMSTFSLHENCTLDPVMKQQVLNHDPKLGIVTV